MIKRNFQLKKLKKTEYYPKNLNIEIFLLYGYDRNTNGGYYGVNNIVLDDIYGDRRDEIIYQVLKRPYGNNVFNPTYESSILIMDDKMNNLREIGMIDVKSSSGESLQGGVLGSGDVDGDGFDEILIFSLYPGNTFGLVYDNFEFNTNYEINNFNLTNKWSHTDLLQPILTTEYHLVGKELLLTDVDTDGLDEIVYSTGDKIPLTIDLVPYLSMWLILKQLLVIAHIF